MEDKLKTVMVMGTEKPVIFMVVIADLDEHGQAADISEMIGTYPLDLANIRAQQLGKEMGFPVVLHPM